MPILEQYSIGIIISGRGGRNWGDAQPLIGQYQSLFQSKIRGYLDELKMLPTGLALLNAIDQSGHQCTIYFDQVRAGSAAMMRDNSGNSAHGRMVRRIAPYTANQLTWTQDNWDDLQGSRSRITRDEDFYLERRRRILARSAFSTVEQLAGAAGRPIIAFRDMWEGRTPFDDESYFKACFVLYPWLTPGKGCSTVVRFDMGDGDYKHTDDRPYLDWKHAPPAILLGHELIHAWRMMTGRRLVDRGWEEEAMTVGLPPFSSMQFTENRLRSEAKVAVRDYYTLGARTEGMTGTSMAWQTRVTDPKKWAAR